jgi:hypothetical protein
MTTLQELRDQKKYADKIKTSNKKITNYSNESFIINVQLLELYKNVNSYESIRAHRDSLYNAKEKQYHQTDGPTLTLNHLNDLLNNSEYGKVGTQTFTTQINKWKQDIVDKNNQITTYQKKIAEQQAIAFQGIGQVVPKPITTAAAPAAGTSEGNASFSKDWKYNAPMVKNAYFTSSKGVSESLVGVTNDGNFVDAGKYQDALNAWSGTTGGRGVLQMDRKFVNQISLSQNSSVALDPQMYGFKFLYNPKEIAMSWGLQDKMDPEFIASGQDAFSVISAGLISSTVEITLLLNRIGDFAYINEMGYNAGFGKNADLEDAAIRRLRQNTGTLVDNPYPDDVDVEEIKEIYKKGTMYDLEYLFKTMNGPHATFISKLNGKTADRGWMRPTIVELHLGAGMRYRVRIRELSVTHSIFNSRMVPILSSVRLVLGRFNDGPETTSSLVTYNQQTGLNYSPNP